MNIKDLKFYCWQLNIKNFGQLKEFKDAWGCKTNAELMSRFIKEYNK